jgi:hypothetical protein
MQSGAIVMKRLLFLLVLFAAPAFAQTQIQSGPVDPATCDPTLGQLWFNNSTIPAVLKYCSAVNTWSAVGTGTGATLFPWTTLSSSGTPSLNVSNGSANYYMSVNQNVSGVTFSGAATNGTYIGIDFQENGTGGFTIPTGSFPSNVIFPTGCAFNITANANNWMAWTYDGTNWQPVPGTCAAATTSVGAAGTVQIVGSSPGTFAGSAIVDDGTKVKVGEDISFTGPNPYVDARAYGVRATASSIITPNVPGVTGSINTGTNTATISTNSCGANGTCFVIGDAVTIFGAGATIGLSTPSAPAITPVNTVGATNVGLDVASPTASTSYQFCVSAVDLQQGQTACSSYSTITNGQATLGPVTSSLTSASYSNNVLTVVTSSALPVSQGAVCQVYNAGASFNYEGATASVSGTTLTFKTSTDTRNGGGGSTTSGNVVCWTAIQVKAALPAGGSGTTRMAVYGGAGSATDFLGFMPPHGFMPNTDQTYLVFEWFGSTFSPVVRPYYVAANAPGAATNDSLETTITNVSGTTLTLTGNASNTVAGATILLDQALNINACLQASAATTVTCRLTVPAAFPISYTLNSELVIPTDTLLEIVGANSSGGLVVHDTIFFNNGSGIKGLSASTQQYASSFSNKVQPTINCSLGWPCMMATGNNALDNVQISIPDGGLGMWDEGRSGALIPGHVWSDIFWSLSGNGYTSMAYYCIGDHLGGSGVTNSVFRNNSFIAGQLGFGSMQTPAFYHNGCGSASFPQTFFSGKGRFWRPPTPGFAIDVEWYSYSQANYMPYDSVINADGGSIVGTFFQHGQQIFDTTFAPMLAVYTGIRMGVVSDSATPGGGGGVITTGNGIMETQIGATHDGSFTGQNTNQVSGPFGAQVADPVLGYTTTSGVANKAVVLYDADINVDPLYSVHSKEAAPAAPTCPVSAGGSVPIGTENYQYAFVYPDGGQGTLSVACAAITSSGNQTVTVTAPAGAVGYAFYRNGVLTNVSGCFVNQTSNNVYTDTFSFTCGTPQNFPASGPAGMRGNHQWNALLSIEGSSVAPSPIAGVRHFSLIGDNYWPAFNVNSSSNKYFLATWLSSVSLTNNHCVTWSISGGVTSLGDLGSSCNLAFTNGLGTGYQDVNEIAAPGNPAAGVDRLWLDSSTHQFTCKTSGGGSCAASGGGGTLPTGTGIAHITIPDSTWDTPINDTTALTGQSLVATNGVPSAFSSPGIKDGNAQTAVTSTPYVVLCDSATTLRDRITTISLQSGASVVTAPDHTASGCGGNMTFSLLDEGAGSITVNRGGSDTFTYDDGNVSTGSATSFTMVTGNYCTLNNGAATVWHVRCTTGNATLINGGSVPASASVLGTNSSKQLIADTAHLTALPLQCSDTSGSGTAQVCNTTPTFAPAKGDWIIYYTTTTNTGALTLNVNSNGATAVQKWEGTALASGDVQGNIPVAMLFDGTHWQVSTIGNAPSGGGSTPCTTTNLSFQYNSSGAFGCTSFQFPATGQMNSTTSSQTAIYSGGQDGVFNSAAGGGSFRGGNQTGTGGASSQGGSALLAGGNNAATNTSSVAGTVEVTAGASTGATTGLQGLVLYVGSFAQSGTVTQWNLECYTSTAKTVTDCAANPTNIAGIALAKSGTVQVSVGGIGSEIAVNADAAVTIGHTVCAGATAGKVTDSGGTAACTIGATVGTVIATTGSWPTFPDGTTFPTLSTTLPLIRVQIIPTSPIVVYSTQTASAHTGGTTNSTGAITMVTPGATHIYEFSANVVQTAATVGCSGQPAIAMNLQYKDSISATALGAQQQVMVNYSNSGSYTQVTTFTQTGGNIPIIGYYPSIVFSAASGTAITFNASTSAPGGTNGSGCTTGADFTVQPILKQLQ